MRNYQYRLTSLSLIRVEVAGACSIHHCRRRSTSFASARTVVMAVVLALSCVVLTACGHDSKRLSAAAAIEESGEMTSTEIYRASHLDEHPDLTPGKVSEKFLKFLVSLQSVDDLSVATVSQGLGLPLKRTLSDGYAFRIALPESGWSYGVDYRELARTTKKALSLDFANKDADQDPTPVCEVGLNEFLSELKRGGFFGGPEYGEIGQLESYSFRKGRVDVLIRERNVRLSPDGATVRACIESVSVHSAE